MAYPQMVSAVLAIATNPSNNVQAIYNFISQIPSDTAVPYTPYLSAAPPDYAVALTYTPPSLNRPHGLAIDGSGNVWVANSGGNSITELSPIGVALSPAGGYTAGGTLNGPEDLFIDSSGNVWVTNLKSSTVTELSASGALENTIGSATNLFSPEGVGIDGSGLLWVADTAGAGASDKALSVFSAASGAFQMTLGSTTFPAANRLVVDTMASTPVVWVATPGAGGVEAVTTTGTVVGAVSGGGQQNLQGVSVDNGGNVWVTDSTAGSVTEINGSAMVVAQGPISVGGIASGSTPYGIATDSANNVWVTNYTGNSITGLTSSGNALSPSAGFTAGGTLSGPRNGIAIDSAGDIWVANETANSVTEFIGLAAPVKTPRYQGRPVPPS